ncbi:HAMP domain-containing protein [Rhodobacterales bacterium HKCCE2091]|nr:HAMP domain-containing protein [Rhodobacterales bacterium HKCCE2091]
MILEILGKIVVRLGLILAVLAGIVGFAIVTATGSFRSVSGNMTEFEDIWLADLQLRAGELAEVSHLQASFAHLVEAGTLPEIEAARAAAQASVAAIRDLNGAETGATAEVAALVDTLAAARAAEVDGAQRIDAATEEFDAILSRITAIVTDLQDQALFEMTIRGEETIGAVGQSLDTIVTGDVAQFGIALQARAAANSLVGTSLAIAGTRDPALRSILSDLASSADDTLDRLMPSISDDGALAAAREPLHTLREVSARAGGAGAARGFTAEILAAGSEVDRALATAADEIEFDLFLAASDTRDTNEATIRDLIDVHLARIQSAADLSTAVRATIIHALQAATAGDAGMVALRQDNLTGSAEAMMGIAAGFGDEVTASLEPLAAAADPDTGIAALRAASLSAAADAARIATDADAAVSRITGEVIAALETAVTGIADGTADLSGDMRSAEDRVVGLGAVAGLAILATLLLAYFTIARPVNRVALATERLSSGNLDALSGLRARRGEIGRMVRALTVFRDGLIERARMAEATRAAKEADEARAAAQAQVVEVLGRSLQKLSEGDLDVTITETFEGEYAALQRNFNSALSSLSSLLLSVSETGLTIHGSVDGIAGSTVELSRRTESAAATLAETSATLNELTSSVTATAEGARRADEIGQRARTTAEEGAEVMRHSAQSMSSIQAASEKIARVVGVIDDIAFQTSLLALNAGVEAARAGESGRGFAVVASEVRALAMRCSDAAREIKELIAESNQVIGEGVAASGQAGQSLDRIVAAVAEMADQITTIAGLAETQASTITEINAATGQLDEVTQRNAAMFEETSAETTVLAREASSLGEKLSAFRLPGNSGAPGHRYDDGTRLAS